VRKANAKDSRGLIHLVVRNLFLSIAILKLMLMKKDPRRPPITPKTIAVGKSLRALMFLELSSARLPNLREDPDQSPLKLPLARF
jgi:hypothetical protein